MDYYFPSHPPCLYKLFHMVIGPRIQMIVALLWVLCIFFGGNLITWGSKKQPTVSRSSTEAEFRCLANAASKLVWIKSLFQKLRITFSKPPILWCDNLGGVHLSANILSLHSRTKNVELDIYFVRDLVFKIKL